jgi:hypothetical protein
LLALGSCATRAVVCAGEAVRDPGSASTAADSFKRFVASPPTISRIVFAEHYSQRYGVYPTKFFEGKWQTNGYLVIEWGTALPGPDNQTGFFEFAFGKYEHSFWTVNGFGRQLTVRLDSDIQPGAENQRPRGLRPSGLVHLDRALNMGIEHVWIASIIWKGDGFSCATEEAGIRELIDGELETKQGKAAGLRLSFSSRSRLKRIILEELLSVVE